MGVSGVAELNFPIRARHRWGDNMTALTGWENFYGIVGSSAGALIGLRLVVITLIADMPIGQSAAQAGDAFATPTIVHFGAALLLSAIPVCRGAILMRR